MEYWYWYIPVILGSIGLFMLCRPIKAWDPEAKGRWVIVNRATGLEAYHGNTFPSEKSAERALTRLTSRWDSILPREYYEIHQLI